MGKSKKKRQKDFQKVKLKVGRKLKKGDNVTNASFKTRTVQVSQQLKTGQVAEPSTRKKQNIVELLSQCRHYNTSVRHDAVTGLRELVVNFPEIVSQHLAAILEKSAELFIDKDAAVRQGVIRLLKVYLPRVTEKQISPFFPLLCAHLCCAMTHIYDEIQLDSLLVLDILLETFPYLMVSKSNQVLINFVDQISRHQGHGKGSRSLTTNPNSKTSSLKWRISVLNRLEKFLVAILDSQKVSLGSHMDPAGHKLHWSPDKPTYANCCPRLFRHSWETPGFTLSSSEALDTRDTVVGKFQSFVSTLVPLMIECWIESMPNKQKSSGSGDLLHPESMGIIVSILNVTQLLGECTALLDNTDKQESLLGGKYMKEFQQHFLSSFPYSLLEVPGKKSEKVNQVSAESINLSICDIMTQFLTPGVKSDIPSWLPDIVTYLKDFIGGRYKSKILAQSSKMIVKILERLIKSDLENNIVEELLSYVLNRYKAAHCLSAEKKVYLKFLSDVCLSSQTQKRISEKGRTSFLSTLPELLNLAARDNNQEMAAMLLTTLKRGAIQSCAGVLDQLSKCCLTWFGNEQDMPASSISISTHLWNKDDVLFILMDSKNREEILNLLYYLPNIDVQLYNSLFMLTMISEVKETEVSYMLQVLHNRYLKKSQDQFESANYLTFLTKFLIPHVEGIRNRIMCGWQRIPPLGAHRLIDPDMGIPDVREQSWIRHSYVVKMVCRLLNQFVNQDQVNSVVLAILRNQLDWKCISTTSSYGILKYLESLSSITDEMLCFKELYVSTLEDCINKEKQTELLKMAAHLLIRIPDGLLELLKRIRERLKGICGQVNEAVKCCEVKFTKICLIFLNEKTRDRVKRLNGCVSVLKDIVSYLRKSASLETLEMEPVDLDDQKLVMDHQKLVTELAYLVSTLEDVPSLQDICRHEILQSLREEDVDHLLVPHNIKQFLRYEL